MAGVSAAVPRDIKVTGLVCVPHMLSHTYYLCLAPIVPVLIRVFDVSYTEMAMAMTLFGLAAGLGQTPMGFLVDRVGGRRLLIAGLACQAGSVAMIGLVSDFWQLLVLFTVTGLAHTVYHPADYAILSAAVPRQRLGRAYGIHSFTGNLGFALAPLVMIGVTEYWGWRAAFFTIGGIGLAYTLVLWWFGALLDEDAPARPGTTVSGGVAAAHEGPEGKTGVALLLSLPILMCFLFFVMQMMGLGGLRQFLVGALDMMFQTPLSVTNTALTGLLLGSALGILAGADWADRAGPRIMTAVLTLVPAALLIILIGSVQMPALLLTACISLAGFLQGFLIPSRDLLIRSVTPDGSMGKVMGFVSSGANLAGGLVPLLFGMILDHNAPEWIFWISAMFIAGALFTFITVRGRFA